MNKTIYNILRFTLLTFISLSMTIILYAQVGIKVSTPYGEMEFCDDDNSTNALERFSKASGDYRTDSLNTLAIINVCKASDGALSEIMDYICLEDFINKPNVVIDIYLQNENILEEYINFLAIGVYNKDHFDYSDTSLSYADKLENEIKKTIDNEDRVILSHIMSLIKLKYKKYLKMINQSSGIE